MVNKNFQKIDNFGFYSFVWPLIDQKKPESSSNDLKPTDLNHNYGFWENSGKNFEKISDFGGDDGLSNRFFERFPTFPNFWRLDFDRTGQGL